MEEKAIGVGLLGVGTVGTEVWRVLVEQKDLITAKVGRPLRVVRALVRDTAKVRPAHVDRARLTTDPEAVLNDPAVEIVVEMLGGVEPAAVLLAAALEAGRDVVTANKDVIAAHGPKLLSLAERMGVGLHYEASVAGGIPILTVLRDALVANRVEEVLGIVNGTTNYMLTKMSEDGLSFEEALRQAQALGYAETDPTADVDAWDAARKLVILALMAFGAAVPLEAVEREGIRRITARDVALARELGYVIKLVAVARHVQDRVALSVRPTLVPLGHPLAAVRDAFNAVFVRGQPVGELMFVGQGAGGGPTASAVVGDLMAAARERVLGRRPEPGPWHAVADAALVPADDQRGAFYLRLHLLNRPGAFAEVARLFGEHGVNLRSILQKGEEGAMAEVVMVTFACQAGQVRRALAQIGALASTGAIDNVIRIEESAP